MNPDSSLILRELEPPELHLALPLVGVLNPSIPHAELERRLGEMIPLGYHCIAAFLGDQVVGVAGFWIGVRFWCGRYMDVDNVVVDPGLRSGGIGSAMMDWLHRKAGELGCLLVVLDSYVDYDRAHRFYFREGYRIRGFHFTRDVPP